MSAYVNLVPRYEAPKVGSMGFRLCLYFALNPDEELTSADVCTKFGTVTHLLHASLMPAVKQGWLTKEREGKVGQYTYAPGPKLLKAIGREESA